MHDVFNQHMFEEYLGSDNWDYLKNILFENIWTAFADTEQTISESRFSYLIPCNYNLIKKDYITSRYIDI